MASSRRTALPLLVVLALSACESTTEPNPPPPRVDGTWTGVAHAGFNNFWDFALSLQEDASGRITGTGRLAPVVPQQGLSAHDFVVRLGVNGYPDVLLSLATEDFLDVLFSGQFVQQDAISGHLNGSGYQNAPVTLTRNSSSPE